VRITGAMEYDLMEKACLDGQNGGHAMVIQ